MNELKVVVYCLNILGSDVVRIQVMEFHRPGKVYIFCEE